MYLINIMCGCSVGFVIGLIFGCPYDKNKQKSILSRNSYFLTCTIIGITLFNLKDIFNYVLNNDILICSFFVTGLFFGLVPGYFTMRNNHEKFG